MVIVRRSASVFLAVWGVSSMFWGCQATVTWMSLPPIESCVTASPSLGTWLGSGVVLLIASVLWFAPWSRFIGYRPRTRPLIPGRSKPRLARMGGWLLMVLGLGVIVSSVWGVFSVGSACGLEIGCYNRLTTSGVFREPAFGLIRVLGVGFGLSALVWGSLEARLDPRHFVRQLVQAAVVFLVLVTLFARGYPGWGRLQATAFVIVIILAVPVMLFREVIAGWLGAPLRSRYALVAAMALSCILGGWTFVLASVSPLGCRGFRPAGPFGLGRCTAELRSATLLAVAAAATGSYLAYARWAIRAPGADRDMVRRSVD